MTANELREKYLQFFKEKGHAIVPSAALVPENDPTTLFTGSGMQPMISYLLGEKHPLGTRIADSQKCFRAQDIEEVGDNRHTTLFEMLGNWSLGDYFKKEQIPWMLEFLIKEVGLDPRRIYVTVFRGNEELKISRDMEAVNIWKKEFANIGIEAKDIDFAERDGMQGGRIFYYDEKKNWWSRSGVPANMPLGEPGGPDSEMFWDFGAELKLHENSKFKNEPCHVNCDCGRFLEIGNNVFMQYVKTEKGFEQLPKGNIDFGGGLERLAAASNDNPDVYTTDLHLSLIKKIEEMSGSAYGTDTSYAMQIVADHIKAATFMISDGVIPDKSGRGYVLRRLIRRARYYYDLVGAGNRALGFLVEYVALIYKDVYPELLEKKDSIDQIITEEESTFVGHLMFGRKLLEKIIAEEKLISADNAFLLYSTYGFPFELIIDIAKANNIEVDAGGFNKRRAEHQELSRIASAGMFKGGLADQSEQTTKYHTATHMLNAALRQTLGPQVFQKGSNITAERLRFDFPSPKKLTEEEIKKVEDLVNRKIKEDLPVTMEEITLDEAKERGITGVFESKYGDKVKVYTIGENGKIFSREICGGPHAERTGMLGKFRIVKEEGVSAGVRRIKAILE